MSVVDFPLRAHSVVDPHSRRRQDGLSDSTVDGPIRKKEKNMPIICPQVIQMWKNVSGRHAWMSEAELLSTPPNIFQSLDPSTVQIQLGEPRDRTFSWNLPDEAGSWSQI